MGDARLGVNPDAASKNKRLRRSGAWLLTEQPHLRRFAFLFAHVGLFWLLIIARQQAGAILGHTIARPVHADGRRVRRKAGTPNPRFGWRSVKKHSPGQQPA